MRLFNPTKLKNPSDLSAGRFFFAKVKQTFAGESTSETLGKILFNSLDDTSLVARGEAFPLLPFMKTSPMVDEVVLCLIGPSSNLEQASRTPIIYYLAGVNIWNHPQHTAYTREKDQPVLHPDFQESADVNPMKQFPGDFILEGRRGQSLRFSETQAGTPWKGSASAKPVIILSNGQLQTEEGFTPIAEDINSDSSSIYLTSNQNIPLKESQTFTLFNPVKVKDYSKSQILLNADRVVINSKTEEVILQASTSIGIKGRQVYIEAQETLSSNARRINLGQSADQQAVLGNKLVSELDKLYSELKDVYTQIGLMGSAIGNIEAARVTATAIANLEVRQRELTSTLLSNKTYLSK